MMLNRLIARTTTGVLLTLLAFVPNSLARTGSVGMAQSSDQALSCTHVGGALMTNIGAVAGVTNLGPVFGDLAGSVAATILGQNADGTFNVQHYWVTAAGDTLKLKVAVLTPTFPTSNKASLLSLGEITGRTSPAEQAYSQTPQGTSIILGSLISGRARWCCATAERSAGLPTIRRADDQTSR